MIRARTTSPDETRALAGALAALSRRCDIVLLAGDLGTGKTTFVQGFARTLGITEPVTSPTFTLVRRYPGHPPLVHLDVYRLDHLQEVVDLGIMELIDDDAVTVVEWGDVVAPVLPADFLEVRLEMGDDEDERLVSLRTVGPSWAPRVSALARAVGPWTSPAQGAMTC